MCNSIIISKGTLAKQTKFIDFSAGFVFLYGDGTWQERSAVPSPHAKQNTICFPRLRSKQPASSSHIILSELVHFIPSVLKFVHPKKYCPLFLLYFTIIYPFLHLLHL